MSLLYKSNIRGGLPAFGNGGAFLPFAAPASSGNLRRPPYTPTYKNDRPPRCPPQVPARSLLYPFFLPLFFLFYPRLPSTQPIAPPPGVSSRASIRRLSDVTPTRRARVSQGCAGFFSSLPSLLLLYPLIAAANKC